MLCPQTATKTATAGCSVHSPSASPTVHRPRQEAATLKQGLMPAAVGVVVAVAAAVVVAVIAVVVSAAGVAVAAAFVAVRQVAEAPPLNTP